MNALEIRSGRAVALALGLLLGLPLVPAASVQSAEPGARRNMKAAGRVKSSWTPERLRAARPRPIPKNAFAAAEEAVQGISERAAGSTGAQFTSHRLIPADADLEYPYSTVGVLFFYIPGEGDFYCSGAVLRRRVVVTAGQCLHQGSGGDNGFFEDFLFIPAYRDGDAPYGAWDGAVVSVPTAWYPGGGRLPHAADYGFIEMEDQDFDGELLRIGDVTGTLGWAPKKLRPNHATILGYPENFDGGEQMHQVNAKDFKATSVSTNTVEYGSDMRGGSQGGPLIQDFGVNNILIGVLSYYPTSAKVKTEGASIPDNRFSSVLAAVCNDRPGNC